MDWLEKAPEVQGIEKPENTQAPPKQNKPAALSEPKDTKKPVSKGNGSTSSPQGGGNVPVKSCLPS